MPTSVELRQERARIVEQMRGITEAAEQENRNLDATERHNYDQGEQDFTALTERISRAEALEQREAEQATPLHSGGGRGDDGQGEQADRNKTRRSAFFRSLRVGLGRMDAEQRALVENTAGEVLVPEDLETEIYRALPELTIVRGIAGVRPTNSNRVRRRSLDEVAVGWGKLETGTALTDSMPGTPTEEFTYVEDLYGLAKIGEDELDDTDVNLETFVRDSFSTSIAEAEDTGFTVGSGHANQQPVGFMTAGGEVPTVAAASTTPTIDDFKKLVYGTPAQARRNGRFVMASATELSLSTLKTTEGTYLWQQNVQAGRPNTFLGYPIHNQEDVAGVSGVAGQVDNVAGFGDFASAYRIYDRQGMTLKRLEELYAEDGMIGFKVRFRVGGDVVRPERLRILAVTS